MAGLPAALFRQAKLIEYDLAVLSSASGQFRDAFSGHDRFPLLSLASWLRADLQPAAAPDDVDSSLLLAGVLLAMRSLVLESLADPLSAYEEGHAALVGWLSERSLRELARFIGPDVGFWERRQELAVDEFELALARAEPAGGASPLELDDVRRRVRWSRPAEQLSLAAVEVSGAAQLAPRVGHLVHRLALAFAILDDLSSMHGDLLKGRLTYPIAFVADAAGLPLSRGVAPAAILGALAVTGSLARLLEEAEGLLADARDMAAQLGLPTLQSFVEDALPAFADRAAQARQPAPGTGGVGRHGASVALVRVTSPPRKQALAMAARFLLADPDLRDSWEVHREGMFGADEVVSRFPAGLVLELLGNAGHDVAAPVERFRDHAVANGFRYYDHRWCDADSDTLGLYLRLQARHGRRTEHDHALAAALDCLERNVAARGFVPVWITGCSDEDPERPATIALGEHCGTVAANLLLGLCAAAPDGGEAALRAGAGRLVERMVEVGLGVNVDYPPLYALAAFYRLVDALEERSPDVVPAARLAAARAGLTAELERRSSARGLGPQDAALSTISCHAARRPDLVADDWLTSILKHQRPDGGWLAEPFAAVPNRGGWVSWYASTQLTSALCYEALRYGYLD